MGGGTGDGRVSPPGVEPGALSALLRAVAAAPESREPAPAPLLPGTTIGRFEILRELGRGGFGVVYEARDRELGRQVALKFVRPGRAAVEEGKVAREAEAIARLSHPNLITLHDVGRSEHGPYLVFELLRGKTLQERLDEGALPVPEAVHVAAEVARGLAHAHAEGVVHRDLKPSNVFVTSGGQVKILDFGMAHAFGRRRLSGGTPAYMAPEQWEDDPEDERTDVFALGVMLYRMLSGAYPFPEGKGDWSAGPTTAPRLEIPGASGLAELIETMLAKAPKARPRDGAAVAAALTPVEGALRSMPAGAAPKQVTRRKTSLGDRLAELRRRHLLGLVAVVGMVAVLPGAAWYLWRSSGKQAISAAAPARPSVAVLPFADLSQGQDQAYFADGVADEVRSGLAQIEGLRVIGRTTSVTFTGGQKKVEEIGRELGVESVLEGSVQRSGSRLRILAQLVRAADGSILWTRALEREAGDLFAVQLELSRAVVESLKVRLRPGEGEARGGGTTNAEALHQHLLGRELLRSTDPERAGRALQAFERAVALDPAFAQAWAGLTWAVAMVENLGGEGTSQVRRRRATEAAERAVVLAPALADGYVVRSFTRFTYQLDWAGARADAERAVALEPGSAEARLAYSNCLMVDGDLARAIREAERATDLDPLQAVSWEILGSARFLAGEHDGALVASRRAQQLYPQATLARLTVIGVLVVSGRPEEALVEARKSELPPYRLFGEALALHDLRRPRESQAALEELVRAHAPDAALQVAEVHAWRGEADLAFEWLDRARVQVDAGIGDVRHDPLLRKIRGDRRFDALLRRLDLAVK